jgi:hypothetical protein
MYCHCGVIVWMHFRLEHGSYCPYFTSDQNKAKLIDDCPGCGTSLNLMVTHLEFKNAPNVPTAARRATMPLFMGENERPFLLPAT